MSNTCAFPPTYTHIFRGKKYELDFKTSKALHIPDGWEQPAEGEEIVWDLDGSPGMYESRKGHGDYWEGWITREPMTGKQACNIELIGVELTASELKLALAEALVWAVEVTKGAVIDS